MSTEKPNSSAQGTGVSRSRRGPAALVLLANGGIAEIHGNRSGAQVIPNRRRHDRGYYRSLANAFAAVVVECRVKPPSDDRRKVLQGLAHTLAEADWSALEVIERFGASVVGSHSEVSSQ